MSLGPVELLAIQFPPEARASDVAPALRELVEHGMIRVIDLLFIKKDEHGNVTTREMNDLEDAEYTVFDPLVADVDGLITEDDVQKLSALLENGSSAGLMLFENVWARRFADAVATAQGKVLLNERLPRVVIETAMRER